MNILELDQTQVLSFTLRFISNFWFNFALGPISTSSAQEYVFVWSTKNIIEAWKNYYFNNIASTCDRLVCVNTDHIHPSTKHGKYHIGTICANQYSSSLIHTSFISCFLPQFCHNKCTGIQTLHGWVDGFAAENFTYFPSVTACLGIECWNSHDKVCFGLPLHLKFLRQMLKY